MTDDQPDDAEPDGDQLTATRSSVAEEPATEPATEQSTAGAVDESAATDIDAAPLTDRFEAGAESFVELEDRLAGDGEPALDRARVVGAETVPADEVPTDYPRRIETDQALALGLAVGGIDGPVTAYFAWPPTGDDPLGRLLTALDISRDSFADLNGRRLLVTEAEGYVLPVVPRSGPRGSERGFAGILAGQAANLGLLGAAAVGAVQLPALLLGLLVLHLFVLPVATYLDGWHLRSTTDWEQGPSFWALLQTIPGLNVLVTAAYLWLRRGAQPLAA